MEFQPICFPVFTWSITCNFPSKICTKCANKIAQLWKMTPINIVQNCWDQVCGDTLLRSANDVENILQGFNQLCRVPRNSSWIILEIWIQWRVFLWNSNLGWENRKVSLCPLILCSQNKVLTFRLFLLENFQINNFGKNTLFWVGALTAWLNCMCKMQQW